MNDNQKNRKKISKKKRNNAILYPLYKTFSWDLLCFYSIEFLFYTITKGLNVSEVLLINSIYILSKMLLQIPAVIISDYIGKKNSILLGNILVAIYLIILIISPNMYWIMIANFICALGYDLKTITESNLLYDSVATKGGDGIFTKVDSIGASGYYIIDTMLSIIAGYLFVINNYIPMYISLFLVIISIILSFRFKEIYKGDNKKEGILFFLKEYKKDIKNSFKFIKRSNRMRSYIIFASVFYGLIKLISTCKSDLLVDIGIGEEQFAIIYSVMSLIAAVSVMYSRKVQKYFKNKTLTVMSLTHIISIILIGIISLNLYNNIAMPIILLIYAIMRIITAQWNVTENTYLKNFTTPKSRNRISFTYESIKGIVGCAISMLGALLLNYINIRYSILLIGLFFLAIIIVILEYMKTRFGLKPKQYTKDDLKF